MGDRSPKAKQRDQKQKEAATKAKEKTKKDAAAENGRSGSASKK